MILDGTCYVVINFGRVILYVWSSPPVVSVSSASTLVLYEYFYLCVSPSC